jgi:hypothetical protein
MFYSLISCCVSVSKLKTSPDTTDCFIEKHYFVFGVLRVAAPLDLHLYKPYKNVYHLLYLHLQLSDLYGVWLWSVGWGGVGALELVASYK